MIPYFQFSQFQVGPVTVYVWGLMVALGVLAGTWLGLKMIRERGLSERLAWDVAFWGALGGFVGSRLVHVLVYQPDVYLAEPLKILALKDGGYSSIGAFAGAIILGLGFLTYKKANFAAYADCAAFATPLGYAIGRVGCFLIHDHPGTLTDFVLGVKYPDGVRHDLGLYEAIQGALLAVVMLILWKRKAPAGTYTVLFLVWYGTVRFFLDFLRATDGAIVDARYLGLTPAQYFSIGMVGWGLWLWRTRADSHYGKDHTS